MLEVSDLERSRCGTSRIVLVRQRRAEDAVKVCTFVSERQLQQIAAVRGKNALCTANEVVQLADRVVVRVVVDPAEPDEEWEGRP